MIERHKYYGLGHRNDGVWESVDEIPHDRVLIVNLGGSGCINTHEANGMAHITEQALGLLPTTVAPFGNYVFYSKAQGQKDILAAKIALFTDLGVIDTVNNKKTYIEEQCRGYQKGRIPKAMQELYQMIFEPRILMRDETGNETRLPIEEVKKRMRNLVVVAYSNGTCTLERVRQLTQDKMRELKYNPVEIKEAMRQVFSFNAGTTRPLGLEMVDPDKSQEGRFTNVHFLSRADKSIFEEHADTSINKQIALRIEDPNLVYLKMSPTEHAFVTAAQQGTKMDTTEDTNAFAEHALSNYFSGAYQHLYGYKTPAAQQSTMLFTRIFQNVVSDALVGEFNNNLVALSQQRKNAEGIPALNFEQGPASYFYEMDSKEKRQGKYNPYCVTKIPDLGAFVQDAQERGEKELDLIKTAPVVVIKAPVGRKVSRARRQRQLENGM